MPELPSGTVTFLFTDIEGSTKLWERQPNAMQLALAQHDRLVREAIERNGGYVFKAVGDAFFAVFHTASDAVNAAFEAQLELLAQDWGEISTIPVRIGLHSAEVEVRDNDYVGQAVNRAAKVLGVGYGKQTLLSQSAYELARDLLPKKCTVREVGEHRLRDLTRPEPIYQLLHPRLPAEFPPLRTLSNPTFPNNLPQQVTSFIGREREMSDVKAHLAKTRLLTVVGCGGAGKTRLSLQVAADVLDSYPQGAWFVELASLIDPAMLPQAVADAMGVRETPGLPIVKSLLSSLKEKRLLLVLDNCEHLIDSAARFVDEVIKSSENVTVLATSREPLGIAGELAYRLPSLAVPRPDGSLTVESLNQFEAVRLFIDRGRAVKSDFRVTDENAAALASICFRLDGIPLAIELAAARVRALSVTEINSRLDQRFRLLTGGFRSALPRQQTLRALIDWGYDLLELDQKTLFCRLSVFSGGWTVEAAERVCPDEHIDDREILDQLSSLVEKSLVVYDETLGDSKFRLLQTIREYAAGRLEELQPTDITQDRHLDFFLEFAEAAKPGLSGPEQADWLSRLDSEHDNLRAGLLRGLAEQSALKALRLCGALWFFWRIRGHLSEGREWCSRALRLEGAQDWPDARANVLDGAGILADFQGDFTAARAYHEESLSIRRQIEDDTGIATSLANLGNVSHIIGDYASALACFEESLNIRRRIGDRKSIASSLNNLGNVAKMLKDYAAARLYYGESMAIHQETGNRIGIAQTLNNLGNVNLAESDYDAARANYEKSVAIRKDVGDQGGIGNPLHNLGDLAHIQGDLQAARAHWKESLAIFRDLGDRWSIAYLLEDLAALDTSSYRACGAARLLSAADVLREQIGAPRPEDEQDDYLRSLSIMRARLGDAAFDAAWADGRAMTMDQAIDLAMSDCAA